MNETKLNLKGQVVYFSHGGGPMPILGDASHEKMVEFMSALPEQLHKPKSIVVFSAHWEEAVVTIQSGQTPTMLYDYYGFPEAAYHINYSCVGHRALAQQVANLLEAHDIPCKLDENRPYDHGVYIPLMMMYPEADIPVIQVSLNRNLDALTHLKIGGL